MDRNQELVVAGGRDAQEMVAAVQTDGGNKPGGSHQTAGAPSVLAASIDVDNGDNQFFIRVGSIGCSAFGFSHLKP
jgi:hypothetical protein